MMDFGFGAFLEKIEEHFGKWVLRALLLLVGLAVALFCAKMIWDIALGPVARSLWTPGMGDGLAFAVWSGIAWFFGFAITGLITNRLARWRKLRTLNQMLDRTESLDAEMQAAHRADAAAVDALARRAEAALREIEEVRERPRDQNGKSDPKA